ncbi:MAG: hypothetical protein WAN60_15535 [Candidatus Sulfotelmatobacter sp.]
MPPTSIRSRLAVLVFLSLALSATSGAQNINSDLTAHEWGTFTSIAGRDGRAAEWRPQTGSTDLPAFVEHLREANFKAGLRATVRMETPVLYFYSPRETTLSVKVSFAKGLITEWYPHASRVEPAEVRAADVLYQRHGRGSIAWNSVTVSPNLTPSFPRENQGAQYYAARETSAAPLLVKTSNGSQQEKFLFYRGVSTFPPPVSATVSPNGGLHITNLAPDEIPSVILFERRGDKLGYRLGGALPGEMSLDPPELTSTFESLNRDLEDILTNQGLYPDEARAMIATWRDSWFEEGSRLFYIVPTAFVNTILPLTINPAPSQTVRVFVGRLELVTPATTQAVEKILATHDVAALQKYNRFLEPILEQIKAANPAKAPQIEKDLELTYASAMPQPQPPK